MRKSLFAVVGSILLLQGCSKIVIAECNSDFAAKGVKDVFSSEVGGVTKRIMAVPGVDGLGWQAMDENSYDLSLKRVVQEEAESGYRCNAALEIVLKQVPPEMSPVQWLKPEFNARTLPLLLISQLAVEPYEAGVDGDGTRAGYAVDPMASLEQAIVFREHLKDPDHDVFKISAYSHGHASFTNTPMSDQAISTMPYFLVGGKADLVAELMSTVKLVPEAENRIEIPVQFNISIRKVDGVVRDYLDIDNAEDLTDAAISTYVLTSLARMFEQGKSNYAAIVGKYDTEQKRVELFAKNAEKFHFYNETLTCKASYGGATYSMKNFRKDFESGALKFVDSKTFEVDSHTCELNAKRAQFLNEKVLPGAALLVARGAITVGDSPVQPALASMAETVVVSPESEASVSGVQTTTVNPSIAEPSRQRASGPSFDCSKASSAVEKMICLDADLSNDDRELNEIYRLVSASLSDTAELRREMNAWRRNERDSCSNAQCVRTAYASKIEALAKRANR